MSNWGGKRKGAGRKPAPIKNKLIQKLDGYIEDRGNKPPFFVVVMLQMLQTTVSLPFNKANIPIDKLDIA